MLPTTINSKVTAAAASEFSGTKARTYTLIRQGATDSLYRDTLSSIADPRTLRVAHESSKDGNLINSAIILRQEMTDSVTKETSAFQVTLKVSYDARFATRAHLAEAIAEIGAICARATGVVTTFVIDDGSDAPAMESNIPTASFLNLEH